MGPKRKHARAAKEVCGKRRDRRAIGLGVKQFAIRVVVLRHGGGELRLVALALLAVHFCRVASIPAPLPLRCCVRGLVFLGTSILGAIKNAPSAAGGLKLRSRRPFLIFGSGAQSFKVKSLSFNLRHHGMVCTLARRRRAGSGGSGGRLCFACADRYVCLRVCVQDDDWDAIGGASDAPAPVNPLSPSFDPVRTWLP